MREYEVVWEVENLCCNNQMRDVFFYEIETDDPVGWLKNEIKGKDVEMNVEEHDNGNLTVFVNCCGTVQKFLFTLL